MENARKIVANVDDSSEELYGQILSVSGPGIYIFFFRPNRRIIKSFDIIGY